MLGTLDAIRVVTGANISKEDCQWHIHALSAHAELYSSCC
jgi:hypothetical protein